MPRRRKSREQRGGNTRIRSEIAGSLGGKAIGESIPLLAMPTSALEIFGGKEGFSGFLDFIEKAKAEDEPKIAAFLVTGQELYPGTGLPSVFIAENGSTAYHRGQQMLMSAMFSSTTPEAGWGNVVEGKAAFKSIDGFIETAVEVMRSELTIEQIQRATELIAKEK